MKIKNLNASSSKIKNINNITEIEEDLRLVNTPIEKLGQLKSIGNFLDLENCERLQSLQNIEHIGTYLNLKGCFNITSFGKLKTLGGFHHFVKYLKIKSLENITEITLSDLDCWDELEDLGNLLYVHKSINLIDSKVKSLGNLTMVNEEVDCRDSKIESLGNLKKCKLLNLGNCKNIFSLGKLEEVESIYLYNSSVIDLSSLKKVKVIFGFSGNKDNYPDLKFYND